MRLGDDILMLHRHDRNVEPDHAPGLAGEAAGGADDVFAGDLAPVGGHDPFVIGLLRDRQHAGMAMDRGAQRAGAGGERLGEIGGLDIAVIGMADRADEAVWHREGPDFGDLLRREKFDIHTDGSRHAGILRYSSMRVAAGGEADIADARKPHILPVSASSAP